MPIPSRGRGGKPVTRALLAAPEESAPGANVPNLRRIDGKAPAAAAGTGAGEPTKVVLACKSDPWCSRRT
jgi:hypothetical protein